MINAVLPGSSVQTRWTLLSYGGLALPLWVATNTMVNYLPAFYAQELHLSVGLVGLVFLSARLWDGAVDLLVGWLSDRSMSPWGRRKPWAILGAPFLMVSTWFLCSPPAGAGLSYLAVWAALFYTSWTAMYIPYISWGTELANGYAERNRVGAFREFFNIASNLFFAMVPLIFLPADAPLRDVLFLIAIAMLVMLPLTAVPLGLFVKDPAPAQKIEISLSGGLAALAKDPVMVRFAIARLLFWIEEGINNSLLVFSVRVGLGLSDKLFWAIFIIYVATLSALPLTMRLAKRIEKHRLLAGALTVYAFAYGMAVLLPPGNFMLAAALWTVVGIVNSAMLILPTSILADIIDRGEAATGERRSGSYAAIDNLMIKIGLALGVGVSFGLMELIGYDPGAAHHTAADALNIRLLGFGLPCLLLIPVIVLYMKHPITRQVQRDLRERIDARRGAECFDPRGGSL